MPSPGAIHAGAGGWRTARWPVTAGSVNRKRIQRLWREEGLPRPTRATKRRRLPGTSQRLRAEHPNHVWAIDFQFDETEDGRRLKLTNVVDEHTREALEMRVARTATADDVVATLDKLVADHGAPKFLRMDNGPELIAWAVRDWCRLSGTGTIYIEPGSPWENPFAEAFNGRVRDELLNSKGIGTDPARFHPCGVVAGARKRSQERTFGLQALGRGDAGHPVGPGVDLRGQPGSGPAVQLGNGGGRPRETAAVFVAEDPHLVEAAGNAVRLGAPPPAAAGPPGGRWRTMSVDC